MKNKLEGLALAFFILALIVASWRFGYAGGIRSECTRWQTAIVRRHLGYWIVGDGEPYIEFRYVPKVRETCVKQEETRK